MVEPVRCAGDAAKARAVHTPVHTRCREPFLDSESMLEALQVVAAVAAVIAVVQASRTVRETKAMRREERIARLPELVGDLGEKIAHGLNKGFGQHPSWSVAHAARERLRAILIATGRKLPACEALTRSPLYPASEEERARLPFDELDRGVTAAMDEVVDLLREAVRT